MKNVGRKGIEPSIVATIEFTAQPVNQQTEPSFFYILLVQKYINEKKILMIVILRHDYKILLFYK